MADVKKEYSVTLEHSSRNSTGQRFCSNMGDTDYQCICRRTKLPGRDLHSEKVREIGRR